MLHGVVRYVMPLLIVAMFLTAVPVQAGPILDWLMGRHRQQWQVASVVDPCTTTMMVGTCAPTTQMQQVVVSYAPQTRFRTAWHRVPVTQYRPVTAIDPCTGSQVTTMRPCVAYQWQVRRVPMRRFRPRFSTVPVVTAPAAPATVMSPADCMACPTVPSATPYYSAPGAVVSPGPATVAPSMPDATTVPARPGVTPGVPNGVQPADTVPSLDPGQMQTPGTQSYYPPADAETRRATEPNGTYPPDARHVPQGQGHRGVTAPANNSLLRPVPDPDAIQPPPQQHMPADRHDPRDRTADRWVRDRQAAFAVISWPTTKEGGQKAEVGARRLEGSGRLEVGGRRSEVVNPHRFRDDAGPMLNAPDTTFGSRTRLAPGSQMSSPRGSTPEVRHWDDSGWRAVPY